MRWSPLLLLLILVFPAVEAVSYANLTLNTSSTGTAITFNAIPVECAYREITPLSISLVNCSITNGSNTVTSSMNFTYANNVTDSISFPRVTASSGNTVTIANGLNFSVPVALNASTNGIIPSTPSLTYPNGSLSYPTTTYDALTRLLAVTVMDVPPGETVLTLSDACGVPGNAVCVGYAGGGGGGSVAGAVNQSVNASNSTVLPTPVSAGTVVVEGDRDVYIFGALVLVGFVVLVLGLRGRS